MAGNTKSIQKPNGASKQHHLFIVTGTAGCGKTTIGQYLASTLDFSFIEGDQFHPEANIEKMSKGIPLRDSDRWEWLTLLRKEILRQFEGGSEGLVVSCSALKRKYRDVLRVSSDDVVVHFLCLSAPEAVILNRVGLREGHYMKANMVHSQFMDLEPPMPEETDVISIDVSKSPAEVKREVLEKAQHKVREAGEVH